MSKLPLPKTSTRAVPPVESCSNKMVPPLAINVALPAVEVNKKSVLPPPLLVIVALPAVELSWNSVPPPPLLVMVA